MTPEIGAEGAQLMSTAPPATRGAAHRRAGPTGRAGLAAGRRAATLGPLKKPPAGIRLDGPGGGGGPGPGRRPEGEHGRVAVRGEDPEDKKSRRKHAPTTRQRG